MSLVPDSDLEVLGQVSLLPGSAFPGEAPIDHVSFFFLF